MQVMGNYFGKRCYIVNCDEVGYELACTWQANLVEKLKTNHHGVGYLLLMEHPPVITVGRSGSTSNILASSALLKKVGVHLAFTSRGGDVTYHGPGQLLGYPVLRLPAWARGVHAYMRRIEELLILALSDYGIKAHRREGFTGVWAGKRKVAAIGVAFSRWVASHGFALNVAPDISHFRLIRPCGIRDGGITSMSELLGHPLEMEGVRGVVAKRFRECFPFPDVVEVSPEDPFINPVFQNGNQQDR